MNIVNIISRSYKYTTYHYAYNYDNKKLLDTIEVSVSGGNRKESPGNEVAVVIGMGM